MSFTIERATFVDTTTHGATEGKLSDSPERAMRMATVVFKYDSPDASTITTKQGRLFAPIEAIVSFDEQSGTEVRVYGRSLKRDGSPDQRRPCGDAVKPGYGYTVPNDELWEALVTAARNALYDIGIVT